MLQNAHYQKEILGLVGLRLAELEDGAAAI